MAVCAGSPTFEAGSKNPNRFLEWPVNIPGYICKTPPFGRGNAPRFSQCCSGPVFNVTSPSSRGDVEYPMSCAVFCQVDPRLGEPDEGNPDDGGLMSRHMMCLTDGGKAPGDWEVVCATNTVAGSVSLPTSDHSSTIPGVETGSVTSSAIGQTTNSVSSARTGAATTNTGLPTTVTTGATLTPSSGGNSLRRLSIRGFMVKGWVLSVALMVSVL